MYLESSARRRGLNNQKKKRERDSDRIIIFFSPSIFTCKVEKKILFRSGRENLWRRKSEATTATFIGCLDEYPAREQTAERLHYSAAIFVCLLG